MTDAQAEWTLETDHVRLHLRGPFGTGGTLRIHPLRAGAEPVSSGPADPALLEGASYSALVQSKTGAPVRLHHDDPVVTNRLTPADGGRTWHGKLRLGAVAGRTRFRLDVDGVPDVAFALDVQPTRLHPTRDLAPMRREVETALAGFALRYLRPADVPASETSGDAAPATALRLLLATLDESRPRPRPHPPPPTPRSPAHAPPRPRRPGPPPRCRARPRRPSGERRRRMAAGRAPGPRAPFRSRRPLDRRHARAPLAPRPASRRAATRPAARGGRSAPHAVAAPPPRAPRSRAGRAPAAPVSERRAARGRRLRTGRRHAAPAPRTRLRRRLRRVSPVAAEPRPAGRSRPCAAGGAARAVRSLDVSHRAPRRRARARPAHRPGGVCAGGAGRAAAGAADGTGARRAVRVAGGSGARRVSAPLRRRTSRAAARCTPFYRQLSRAPPLRARREVPAGPVRQGTCAGTGARVRPRTRSATSTATATPSSKRASGRCARPSPFSRFARPSRARSTAAGSGALSRRWASGPSHCCRARRAISTNGCAACSRRSASRRLRDAGFDAVEHRREPLQPHHAELLADAEPLEKVVRDGGHVGRRLAVDYVFEQRDEAARRRRLGRGVGVQRGPAAVDFGEKKDGRLALVDAPEPGVALLSCGAPAARAVGARIRAAIPASSARPSSRTARRLLSNAWNAGMKVRRVEV